MNYLYKNEINDNLDVLDINRTTKYKEKVETIEQQVPSLLNDFKKYYVLYNKNPESPEYKNYFENTKTNLNNLNASLFVVSNEIQTNMDKDNIKIEKINKLLYKTKKENTDLKKKISIIEGKKNTSNELISNYTTMYDNNYLRNWALSLSIIFASYLIYKKIYNKNTTVINKIK